MASLELEQLTWPEAERAFQAIPILLLPIGAILKEHGPHLPLNTDYLVARELARRVAHATDVLVCPPVTFGYYPAFVHFPGSVNLAADTFRAMVEQIILSLAKNGAQKFLILNTGVSTTAPLTLASNHLAAQNIRVALANILNLGTRADSVVENKIGSHANEHETSVMLATDASVVRMELARAELQAWMTEQNAAVREVGPLLRTHDGVGVYCPSGVIGDPTRATTEKGETILRAMVEDVVAFCKRWK